MINDMSLQINIFLIKEKTRDSQQPFSPGQWSVLSPPSTPEEDRRETDTWLKYMSIRKEEDEENYDTKIVKIACERILACQTWATYIMYVAHLISQSLFEFTEIDS